jgi:hypothetical protein
MLADITYARAVEILFPDGRISRTDRNTMRLALMKIPGLEVGSRFVGLRRPREPYEIYFGFNALLQSAGIGGDKRYWHWLVWSAEQGKVLDPSGKDPRRKIVAYLKVSR